MPCKSPYLAFQRKSGSGEGIHHGILRRENSAIFLEAQQSLDGFAWEQGIHIEYIHYNIGIGAWRIMSYYRKDVDPRVARKVKNKWFGIRKARYGVNQTLPIQTTCRFPVRGTISFNFVCGISFGCWFDCGLLH